MSHNRVRDVMLAAIALSAGLFLSRWWPGPEVSVRADSGRFDYVAVVAPQFFYQGSQGVLLLDKRNGNAWFVPRANDTDKIAFKDPVLIFRVPLEKLDEAAR